MTLVCVNGFDTKSWPDEWRMMDPSQPPLPNHYKWLDIGASLTTAGVGRGRFQRV